jgi:hypothetical protein
LLQVPPNPNDVGKKFSLDQLDPYEIPLAETGELRNYACSGAIYFISPEYKYKPEPVKQPPKFINESMIDEAARLLNRTDDIRRSRAIPPSPIDNFFVIDKNGKLWDGENVR